jgi:hypothetical protein
VGNESKSVCSSSSQALSNRRGFDLLSRSSPDLTVEIPSGIREPSDTATIQRRPTRESRSLLQEARKGKCTLRVSICQQSPGIPEDMGRS